MTRSFVRLRSPVPGAPFDAPTAFREALAADGGAEIWDAGQAAEPTLAFLLHARGIAVLILTPDGQHLGTFADPVRAVAHGFELLDRAAEQLHAARPRPTHAHRRVSKEFQP